MWWKKKNFSFVTYTIVRSIISSKKCVLCTRPIQVHPHPEQWVADDAAPGEQLGARRPAQGSYPSRGPFCRSRDSNPRPWATSPALHTPGHGRPWKDEALHGFACHPFAGAMLIFSTPIKFLYMCRHDEISSNVRFAGMGCPPAQHLILVIGNNFLGCWSGCWGWNDSLCIDMMCDGTMHRCHA